MEARRTGITAGLGAYAMWGLFPLYFPLLEPAGGVEIVAHRVIWSLVFVAMLLTALRRWAQVGGVLRDRRAVLVLAGASVCIAGNWLVFVYGVNSGHVVETSLGYFINPLVSVVLGVVFFAERLRPLQWTAVGIAAVAVLVVSLDYGHPPWIAIALALSFGTYGLLKKLVRVDAVPGLFVETALVAVPASLFVVVLQARGDGAFGAGAGQSLLLVSSGLATAVPLLMFAAAARRIPLSTVGLLQYVTPLMQLSIGVFVDHEPMPPARLAGFAIVWIALAVFTADGLRSARARGAPETPAAIPVEL